MMITYRTGDIEFELFADKWLRPVCFSSQHEARYTVDLNNFGFFPNGTLDVNMTSLRLPEKLMNYSAYPVSVYVCTYVLVAIFSGFQPQDKCYLKLYMSWRDFKMTRLSCKC